LLALLGGIAAVIVATVIIIRTQQGENRVDANDPKTTVSVSPAPGTAKAPEGEKATDKDTGKAVAPPAKPGLGKWTMQQSGITDDLHDVAFVNDQVGVAVGAHQTILRTTDGGKTWARVIERVKDGPELGTVLFANDKLGYAITHIVGAILHTKDGGASWAKMPIPDEKETVYSLNGRHYCTHAVHGSSYYYLCWGLSGTRLFKTENAGKDWIERKTKPELKLGGLGGGATGIAFPDGGNGCFVNTKPSAFRFNWGVTENEGQTWKLQKFEDAIR